MISNVKVFGFGSSGSVLIRLGENRGILDSHVVQKGFWSCVTLMK